MSGAERRRRIEDLAREAHAALLDLGPQGVKRRRAAEAEIDRLRREAFLEWHRKRS